MCFLMRVKRQRDYFNYTVFKGKLGSELFCFCVCCGFYSEVSGVKQAIKAVGAQCRTEFGYVLLLYFNMYVPFSPARGAVNSH